MNEYSTMFGRENEPTKQKSGSNWFVSFFWFVAVAVVFFFLGQSEGDSIIDAIKKWWGGHDLKKLLGKEAKQTDTKAERHKGEMNEDEVNDDCEVVELTEDDIDWSVFSEKAELEYKEKLKNGEITTKEICNIITKETQKLQVVSVSSEILKGIGQAKVKSKAIEG